MKRATILPKLASLVVGTVLASCGGSDELSAREYRLEVRKLCEQPVRDLENKAPTPESDASEIREWARNQRNAARDLRALNGPPAEERAGRRLAGRMDEMAEELDAMAAAVDARDDDALSVAVGDGVVIRGGVIASCAALGRPVPA